MYNKFDFNFKTESLYDTNIMLLYSCNYNSSTSLMKIWSEILEEYNFLSEFYSDYVEPTKEINDFLEYIDRIEETAIIIKAYFNGIKRWLLVCGKIFFNLKNNIQKAILLHEIGHIIVNEYNLFESLFIQYQDVDIFFDVFCSNINRDNKLFLDNEKWLRELFDFYVFDIIKMPGELFANLWVKINCNEYFKLIVNNQFINYKNINIKARKGIKNRLLKHVLVYLDLRLQFLITLIENDSELYNNIIKYNNEILKELQNLLSKKEYFIMLDIKNKIKEICNSPEEINKKYLNVFNFYINSIKLLPYDFLQYP